MRSPDHPIDRDLDVADLRRQPPMGSVKRGHGNQRSNRGLRRYLLGFMVAVVLLLFSAVVWFAYQDLMPGGDSVPPLIRADAGELKRQPDERGGLPLVNEESAVVQALDEPESPVRVERIVPRESTAPRSTADVIPEVLEAEPAPAATDLALAAADTGGGVAQLTADAGPATAGAAAGDEAASGPATGGEATGGPATGGEAAGSDPLDTLLAEIIEGPENFAAIEPAAGPSSEDEPVLAERVPMPADGMTLPGEVTAEAASSAVASRSGAPSSVAPRSGADGIAALEASDTGNAGTTPPRASAPASQAPAASASTIEPQTAAASPASPAPAASASPDASTAAAPTAGGTQPPAAPAVPADTVMAALPAPALAQSFNGAFRVQLLAVRDEESAAGAWAGLQQQFPSALGPLRSQVQRAEIGGNTFYRLHAGPFADRSGALAVCDALQTQGADCFVVAPTT